MAALTSLIAGCEMADTPPQPVSYDGYDSLIIDDNLVNFLVAMRGIEDPTQVTAYADCVAAQYALDRGNAFARHVRTNVTEEGGIWRADAVYTFSPTMPRGLRTMDTEIVVENCVAEEIPTV